MSILINEAYAFFKKANLAQYDMNIAILRKYLKEFINITHSHKLFDFGQLQLSDLFSLHDDAMLSLKNGHVRAPYPQCVYNVTIDRGFEKLDMILMVSQMKSAIEITGFLKCSDGWKLPLMTYRYYSKDGAFSTTVEQTFMQYINQGLRDDVLINEIDKNYLDIAHVAIILTHLLNNSRTTTDHVEIDKAMNKKLIARRMAPIPAYNIVRISATAYSKKKEYGSSGLAMRKHDRRGHTRNLRYPDGSIRKTINVQPTTIHRDHPDPVPQGHYVVQVPPSSSGPGGPR